MRDLFFDKSGECDGTELAAMLVEQYHFIGRFEQLECKFTFFLLDLVAGKGGNVLEFRNLLDLERDIMDKPGGIEVQAFLHPLHIGLADCHQRYLHPAALFANIATWLNFCKEKSPDMKTLLKIAVLFLTLLTCSTLRAQNEGNEVFVPISKYLMQGNAENLSAWFADNLEISIISPLNNSSKNQAKSILKTFFETYTPRSFDISHIAGRSNMKYALGTLSAGGETFNVTIFVSCKDNEYKIQQLKIERVQ